MEREIRNVMTHLELWVKMECWYLQLDSNIFAMINSTEMSMAFLMTKCRLCAVKWPNMVLSLFEIYSSIKMSNPLIHFLEYNLQIYFSQWQVYCNKRLRLGRKSKCRKPKKRLLRYCHRRDQHQGLPMRLGVFMQCSITYLCIFDVFGTFADYYNRLSLIRIKNQFLLILA